MKIGVFGDSFADKNAEKIWWQFLQNYGHEVTCFGESGSSIVWSAKQIINAKNDFNFIIWYFIITMLKIHFMPIT